MGVCLSCNKKSEPREIIEEDDKKKKKNNVPSPSPSPLIPHKPTSSFPSSAPPPADHPSSTSSKAKTSKTATSTPRSSSPSSQKKKKKHEGVLPLAEISICNQQYGAEAAEGGKEGTTTMKKKKNENRGVMEGCGMVRTSSCTKEEVESILIQCSRLSRSSSGKSSNENNVLSQQRGSSMNNKAGNGGGGSVSSALKKRSGSKRNYSEAASDEIGVNEEEEQQQQLNSSSKPKETQQLVERSRHSRNSSGEMGGVVEFYYKRSSSKEKLASDHGGTRSASGSRGGSGESKRRVSRSPGKRSGTPEAASSTTQEHKSRSVTRSVAIPVMVPASSSTKPVGKKMSSRAAASRSQSPATRHPSSAATGSSNADGAPSAAPLMSRSSSRRTEISPHRRPTTPQDENKEKDRGEISISDKTAAIRGGNNNDRPRSARSRPHSRSNSLDGNGGLLNSRVITKPSEEEKAAAAAAAAAIVQDIIISSHRNANPKPSETLNSSIQLPACVSKACSIVEAVADLNSNSFKSLKDSKAANSYGNSASDEVLRHVLDSGLNNNNKYVCARRRDVTTTPNSDQFTPQSRSDDGPESSAGSNTFINVNGSSSSWEPTSSDSAECWVDGPLFQKFVMNEGHSSTSTYNVLPSSNSHSREIEEEEEERWCSEEVNAKQKNSGSGGGLVPVMTLSKNVKKKGGGGAA